jgi:vitellogenic carboxypeptidase-like protein
MGLMDEHQTSEAGDLATKVVDLIEEENWEDAQTARVNLLHYIKNVTGLATLLDARRGVEYYTSETGEDYLTRFMNNEEMQASLLNIGPLKWESCSDAVLGRLGSDVPKSVKSSVEELLNRSIPVLLYQGQFDLQDGVASSEAWIRHLEWDGLDRFYGSDRRIWKESVGVLGYVRSHSALTHVVVSNSGHLVPADQAYASQRMIEGWISSKGII